MAGQSGESQLHSRQQETCQQCGSAQLQPQTVRSAFWHEERLVVVEGIPALVCSRCAEQYFDDSTIILIDRLRGQGFPVEQAQGQMTVPIFSISPKANP